MSIRKAAIYILVGPHDVDADKHTKECQQYCRDHALQYDLFREDISEIRESRVEFEHLLSRLRAGEYAVVVVWKLRDLGTSALHFYNVLAELRNKNIEIVIKSSEITSLSTEGKTLFDTVLEIGEFEKKFINERIRASMDTKRALGIRLGRRPGSKDKKPRKKAGYLARYQKIQALQSTNIDTQEK